MDIDRVRRIRGERDYRQDPTAWSFTAQCTRRIDRHDLESRKANSNCRHSYEAANEYLEHEYLPTHNRRFARSPANPEDYHGRKPTARELGEIFPLETERTIRNDWVIRHEGHYLQLQPRNRRYGPTKNKALVRVWENGTMEVYYRGSGWLLQKYQNRYRNHVLRPKRPAHGQL